ncbi:MAG TPA: L,D-transpeptidase [Candidatus Saccharimonadales bacterium]|nr:L,D-transpeptidase [Candidatus Saccharimonadales bacterium]
MRSSSLQSKTVRPGLTAYSFYRSDRHPARRRPAAKARPKRHYRQLALAILVLAAAGLVLLGISRAYEAIQRNNGGANSAAFSLAEGRKQCAGNQLGQLIVVSINRQHIWACEGNQTVYDSPVVTGREHQVDNQTPRGTYHIYAKQTDTTLTGSDSTGQWRDPVSYWMPFLDNQHGTYGFHDATWRPSSDFGNVDPRSDQASHGCVNMPLGAAKWLYDWAPVGTTVTVKD